MIMKELILLVQNVDIDNASQAVNTATQTDIIGVGGIVATIIVGVITCVITWMATIRSIRRLKLTFNMRSYPILSNAFNIHNPLHTDDFKILYKNTLLENPCLLAIDIQNTGNKAIVNPPIRITTTENIELIPGYFEDLQEGYEKVWSIESDTQNSCKVILHHINPKQTAHN